MDVDDSKSLKSDTSTTCNEKPEEHSSDSSSESISSYSSTKTLEVKPEASMITTTTSEKTKLCPKQRTCPSLCFCVCKVVIFVIVIVALFLLTLGFLLTKFDFQCKLDELSPDLYSSIYGQDIAVKKTLDAVSDFCSGVKYNEPLTLVFWGTTGVGKTSFASIFTHHFDSNGQVMPSEYFKAVKYRDWFGSQAHNKPLIYTIDDVISLEEMQDIGANSELFSFPLILVLTTSMEGNLLNESFVEWSVKGGEEGDFVYTGKDPLWLAELKHMNPVIVPFLPLSRATVKLCIEKALNRLNMKYGKEDVEKIASEFKYFHNGKRLFSKIGCKRMNDKVFSVLTP